MDRFEVAEGASIYAMAYYLHEDPDNHGKRYRSHPPLTYDEEAGTLTAAHIGRPVAVEWYARPYGGTSEYRVVSTCGKMPDSLIYPWIFEDGFESGTTDGWSKVVGDG
jgi:hypothetical protein